MASKTNTKRTSNPDDAKQTQAEKQRNAETVKGIANEPGPVGGEQFHYPGGEAQYNADHGKRMVDGHMVPQTEPVDVHSAD